MRLTANEVRFNRLQEFKSPRLRSFTHDCHATPLILASQTAYPIPGIGAWNMIIGFSFIAVGFSLATNWR